jgi:hypothetical protein
MLKHYDEVLKVDSEVALSVVRQAVSTALSAAGGACALGISGFASVTAA